MSGRSAFALAALASVAVKGLAPVATGALPQHDPDLDAALVEDADGAQWVVRCARTAATSLRLEAEARLLEQVASHVPFAVPTPAGSAALDDGARAVVHRALSGTALVPGTLTSGPGLAACLGRTVAVVHDLSAQVVEDAGMPVYEAQEYRQRRLAEVDRAAATGLVPARLLARWESALEEVGAWRFVPCVVHGDLGAESVLTAGDEVTAILDWGEARVADPADDLGWLVGACSPEAFDTVLEAYAQQRATPPDKDLQRRARLSAELAVARWLLHGRTAEDERIVADAVAMLTDLDSAIGDDTW